MLTELRNRGLAGRVDRVLRRPEGVAGVDPDDVARRDRADLRRAHGPNSLRYASKKHWRQITSAMREIYTAPTVEAAEVRFAEFAGEWRATYPAMIQFMGDRLGRVRAVPRVPHRAPQDRLHDQRDRVAERAVPPSGPTSRPLPERAGRPEGALPRRDPAAEEPSEHDRQNQRLEDKSSTHSPSTTATGSPSTIN